MHGLALAVLLVAHAQAAVLNFTVHTNATTTPAPHVWEAAVGSGHAALTLRPDWRSAMAMAASQLGVRAVRFHGLFDDDMGPVVRRVNGSLLYNFTLIDSTFDFLQSIRVAPYVELSFMPTALAADPSKTYLAYKACTSPPAKLSEWAAFMTAFGEHVVQRYGAQTVATWVFEVWNEPNLTPNIFGSFWSGTQAQYFALFNATSRALYAVEPSLQVVGPASAGGGWLSDFLNFTTTYGVPLNGVSTHHYPSSTNRISLLKDLRHNRATIDAANQSGLPLLISEFNSGLLNPLFYTNHDTSYAAAYLGWTLPQAAASGDAALLSYWCVSDVFDEIMWDTTPFHDGYGLVTVDGVPKPAFRALELLHGVGEEAVPVAGPLASASLPPLNVSATVNATHVVLVLSNWDLPASTNGTATARVVLFGMRCTPGSNATVARVDDDNANPRGAWEAMGRPKTLTADQRARLLAASEVHASPVAVSCCGGSSCVSVDVPRQGLAVVYLPS